MAKRKLTILTEHDFNWTHRKQNSYLYNKRESTCTHTRTHINSTSGIVFQLEYTTHIYISINTMKEYKKSRDTEWYMCVCMMICVYICKDFLHSVRINFWIWCPIPVYTCDYDICVPNVTYALECVCGNYSNKCGFNDIDIAHSLNIDNWIHNRF